MCQLCMCAIQVGQYIGTQILSVVVIMETGCVLVQVGHISLLKHTIVLVIRRNGMATLLLVKKDLVLYLSYHFQTTSAG